MPNSFEPLNAGLTRRHHQRLRDVYRSAGWPCLDMLEVELLAAGMLERIESGSGHHTLRVTDAGLTRLAEVFAHNKASRSQHEALVEKVALEMARAGRLVWRGLSLRAKVLVTAQPLEDEAEIAAYWCIACPDVFSIRNTTVEAYLEPVVHEVKVSRADLLGDLKKPAKRAAYLSLGGECWYVLGQTAKGRAIGDPDEIPFECGVMLCEGNRLIVGRPAPRRPVEKLPFHVWMSLSKASPIRVDDPAQTLLGAAGE